MGEKSGRGSGRVRFFVGNRGSGRVNVSPGRVGSKKSDPSTTLCYLGCPQFLLPPPSAAPRRRNNRPAASSSCCSSDWYNCLTIMITWSSANCAMYFSFLCSLILVVFSRLETKKNRCPNLIGLDYKLHLSPTINIFQHYFLCQAIYVLREPRREPSNRRLNEERYMRYISDSARNRTHNLSRLKCAPIPQWQTSFPKLFQVSFHISRFLLNKRMYIAQFERLKMHSIK